MYVVTPRCAVAAAVISAVVLRLPTKGYTQPYFMMHRRLPTADIDIAPQYHQLLVNSRHPHWLGRLSSCVQKYFSRVQFSPSAQVRRGFSCVKIS